MSEPGTVIEETVNAGGNSLSYNATADQYSYIWKTDRGLERDLSNARRQIQRRQPMPGEIPFQIDSDRIFVRQDCNHLLDAAHVIDQRPERILSIERRVRN